jgi:hypothetical protein
MIDEYDTNIMVAGLVEGVLRQVAPYALPEDERLSVLAAVGSRIGKIARSEFVPQVEVGSRYATVELSTTCCGANRAFAQRECSSTGNCQEPSSVENGRYMTVFLSTTGVGVNRAFAPIAPESGARLVCVTCSGTQVVQYWERAAKPKPVPIDWKPLRVPPTESDAEADAAIDRYIDDYLESTNPGEPPHVVPLGPERK